MKIAIDVSPLQSGHKIRGVGFYLEYLKRSLLEYFPDNHYQFFTRTEEIENDIDVVHYPYFEPFFISLPLKKRYKTVVTVHDLTPLVFPEHFPPGVKGAISWQIQKRNLQRMDGIITDSVASQKDITKIAHIKEDKIHVAHLAAAEEFTTIKHPSNSAGRQASRIKELREKYDLPEQFLLYVGDVTWNKNLPRLVEAIKQLDLPLVMVGKALAEVNFDGSNPWNRDMRTVHELTKDDKRFLKLGFVSTDDLVVLYNSATVFVMPSVYEGFGLPVLEAMQSGCPVITTKGGSLAEVAGDGALHVDGYNVEDIAKGIQKVFSDKKLQDDLIKKGFEQAKKFSWQKTAEKTIDAYKQCLE